MPLLPGVILPCDTCKRRYRRVLPGGSLLRGGSRLREFATYRTQGYALERQKALATAHGSRERLNSHPKHDTGSGGSRREKRKCGNYRGVAKTRLERFIRSRGLFVSHVVNASHVCRQRLLLWRNGQASPTLSSIRKLVRAMREVTNNPKVTANDLFPLDDDD